jgi:large repetitive protein
MFMSNFTRGGSGVRFWQAISNLSCCNIDTLTKHLNGMKALAFIMLFAFSMSSVFAQTANRSVFFDRCIDDRPGPSFDKGDFEMLFMNECQGQELILSITENLQGDNCNWQVIYSYNITCGDFSTTTKEFFEGGDLTAPELIGELPQGQSNLNLCFDEIPEGPSIEDIAALFQDECSDVTVTKSGEPTGDDCEWSVIYSYEVFDACGNQYGENVRIEYSGGDTSAPQLKKNAVIPTGNMASELCFLEKEQGPTEEEIAQLFEDNCGNVNVVKQSYSKGTDCKWMAEYTYFVTDDCGNELEPIVIIYQGRDEVAPELNGIPEDTVASCIDDLPQVPKGAVSATDNCDNKVDITYTEDFSQLGLACEGGIVVRTWIATDDCGNSTTETQTITVEPAPQAEFEGIEDFSISCEELSQFQAPFLGYSNGVEAGACAINGEVQGTFVPFTENCGSFVVSFEFIDECDRVSTASVTVTVVDEVAPVLTVPANETVECDAIPAIGQASATDNCDDDVEVKYDGEVRTDGECLDSYTLTRTWTATDNCGNSTTLSQIITVQDTVAPELTIPADETVECDSIPEVGVPSATDNCDLEVEISYDGEVRENGNCKDSYQLIRTWTATDNCGNSTTLSQTISVVDTTAPELTIPANETVECDAIPQVGIATATDNCTAEVNVRYDGEVREDGECANNYQLIRTWTATDDCGNSTTLSQTITVQDTTAPVITVPADETVECDSVPEIGLASATDNCDEQPLVEYVDEKRVDGDCENSYELIRTWSATDSCGNTVTGSQTITVIDTTAPELTVPADETVECDSIPEVGEASATDNCDENPSVEYAGESRVDGECPNSYTLFRVWIATDDCGNQVSRTQEITVVDTTAPVVTAPADITVECDAIPEPGMAEVTDNCDDAPVVEFIDEKVEEGECPNSFVLIRTWRATDSCGNTALDSQAIIVVDTTAPEFNEELPADATVECDSVPEAAVLTATDNCDPEVRVEFIESRVDGNCPSNYTLTRTWTVVDDCGNDNEHVQVITVQDTTAPEVTPAEDLTVECDGQGNGGDLESWLANYGGATATDNCGDVTWTNDFDGLSDDCGATGSATVTFTATDECGNATTTKATFTIVDTTAPDITDADDLTVECDGQGNVEELEAWLANYGGATASDICSDVTWSSDFEGLSDDCGATGSATVTFTATDDCGNSSSTTATFTIVDTVAPEVEDAKDLTVECDGLGNVEELEAWLASNGGASASDICSDVTWSNDFVGLSDDCGATGSATVIFTATDDCGNATSTTATFTIVDTVAPEVVDAENLTVECDGLGNVDELEAWLASNGGASASDICSDVTWSNNFEALSDDCGATGSATVTFTATDDCGNETSTTATFTIVDTTAPEVEDAKDLTVECDGLGNEDELEAWLASNGGASASDICSDVTWSNDFDGLSDDCGATGSATVIFTATDDCGNATSTTATFTIVDTTSPDITEAEDLTVECDGEGNGGDLEAWLANYGGATASDICSDVTWSNDFDGLSDDCGATGSATVTFTATDDCGNSLSTTATFTIVDIVAPEVEDAKDLAVECDGEGNVEELEAWLASNGGASASDICSDVTWSNDFNGLSDDCGATGSATVTFTATDDCGNATSTTATFTIVDTTAPDFEVPQDVTIECDQDINDLTLTGDVTTEFDACSGELEATYSDAEPIAGECIGNYTVIRTWTLVDDCGNTTSKDQTITVQDTTAPTLEGELPPTYVNGLNECKPEDAMSYGVSAAEVAALFVDNCGEVVVTKTVKSFVGTDCNWALMFGFTVADDCGNEYGSFKVSYAGGDQSAPTLVDGAELPASQSGFQCQSEAPDGPKVGVIEALFEDNCSNVIVTALEPVATEGDCDWSIEYRFTVEDACGNFADDVVVIYSGSDTIAPQLTGELPQGDNLLNLCFSETFEGLGEPTEEEVAALYTDNCDGELTVTKVRTEYFNEGEEDCNWQVWFRYTVADACGNEAEPFKVIYQGGDTEAPVKDAQCSEPPMIMYTSMGADCPSEATIALEVGDEITPEGLFTVAGISLSQMNAALPQCFTDNCTAVEDLRYFVRSVDNGGVEKCSAILTVEFEAVDSCGNVSEEALVCEFVIIDDVAPVLDELTDVDFGQLDVLDLDENGLPLGIATSVAWTDDCQGMGETFEFDDSTISSSELGEVVTGNDFIINVTGGVLLNFGQPLGTDSFGLPFYTGVLTDLNGNPLNNLTYTLEYSGTFFNDFDIREDGGLVGFGGFPATNPPSCDADDYFFFDLGSPFAISCEQTEPLFEYSFTRTFSKDDGCGNVGTSAVTYTWRSVDNPLVNAFSNPEDFQFTIGTREQNSSRVAVEETVDFKAYPVPFDKEVTIQYMFEYNTSVTIELFDARGILVNKATNSNYVAGTTDKTMFDMSRNSSQMYYVKLTTERGSLTKKIVSNK